VLTQRFSGVGLLALLTLVAVASRVAPVSAATVEFQSGTIVVTYFDTFAGDDTASFPITFPGSATETYDGTALDPETPLGDDRGEAGATYDLQDLADGATFDVKVFHTNEGEAQRTLGGDVDFGFSFTTDQILHYSFPAVPDGASEFTATFAGVTQNLLIDVFGTTSGSLIDEFGQPVTRTVEGTLPAGTHDLGVFLGVNNGRSSSGGGGEGTVSITLSADGVTPPPVIPLPPAVWTGLASLAGAGFASRSRMLRRRLI
jgi:hypothetical protein